MDGAQQSRVLVDEEYLLGAEGLLKNWESELREIIKLQSKLPHLNSVEGLAGYMCQAIDDGRLSAAGIDDAIGRLNLRGLAYRGKRLRERAAVADREASEQTVRRIVREAWSNANAEPDTFLKLLAAANGAFVFTAHPTFQLDSEQFAKVASLAEGRATPFSLVPNFDRQKISLADEHAACLSAIENFQRALKWIDTWVKEEVFELDAATASRFRGVDVHASTWVGYDLDGRTDISWLDTLLLRLQEKTIQLAHYAKAVRDIKKKVSEPLIQEELESLGNFLELASCQTAREHASFSQCEDQLSRLSVAANFLTEPAEHRLMSKTPILERLAGIESLLTESDGISDIFSLRAEVERHGLGVGEIHLRVNSAQVHNAIRGEIETEGRRLDSRATLKRLTQLINSVEPRNITFANLTQEKTTAKQAAMLAERILKYVDQDASIRFLIAECEAPVTVLSMLYLCRSLGVDRQVDISPLFETPVGLQKAARTMRQLLENSAYTKYVRTRGRVCIQTGFSDAGRFSGQLAATLAIERIHTKLAGDVSAALGREVEVVIFNTHGESLGRGGHPGNLSSRLKYVFSAHAKNAFVKRKLPIKHETSFQGGDGYLWFATPDIALSTMVSYLRHKIIAAESPADPFYDDGAHSLDFFLHLKNYHEELFGSQDYRCAINSFSFAFLPTTGSRAVRRDRAGQLELRDLRAIPHNATLQQLGFSVNVVSGAASAEAVAGSAGRQWLSRSDRYRRLQEVVVEARRLSSADALRAYAKIIDPTAWLERARHASGRQKAADCTAIAAQLSSTRAQSMQRFFDAALIDPATGGKVPRSPDNEQASLLILHSLRLAIISDVFILATKIPRFSSSTGVTSEQLQQMIHHLELSAALSVLREVFPITPEDPPQDLTEVGDWPEIATGDYRQLHVQVFDRIDRNRCRLLEISRAISHFWQSFG